MQATRGTSIAASGDLVEPQRRGRLLFAVVALVGFGLDLVTKTLALRSLEPGQSVPLLGRVLQLRLVRNPGAAFSLGEQFTVVFTVLSAAVLVFVLVRLVPRLGHRGWAIALGLLCAGVSGNLLDRIIRPPAVLHGHVIDFLQLPRWPIFNVADMAITSAAVLIALLAIVTDVAVDGRRHPRPERGGPTRDRSTGAGSAPE